jgi:hypothetical protein
MPLEAPGVRPWDRSQSLMAALRLLGCPLQCFAPVLTATAAPATMLQRGRRDIGAMLLEKANEANMAASAPPTSHPEVQEAVPGVSGAARPNNRCVSSPAGRAAMIVR